MPAFSTAATCCSEWAIAAFSWSMPARIAVAALLPLSPSLWQVAHIAFSSVPSIASVGWAMSWLLWHSTQPRSKIWLCVLSANLVANTVWQVPQTLATAPTPGGAAPWLPWQSLQVGADRSLRFTIAS